MIYILTRVFKLYIIRAQQFELSSYNLCILVLDCNDNESILENLEILEEGEVNLLNFFFIFTLNNRHDLQRGLNVSYMSLFGKLTSHSDDLT